jgi:hypothetical protein
MIEVSLFPILMTVGDFVLMELMLDGPITRATQRVEHRDELGSPNCQHAIDDQMTPMESEKKKA